MSKTPLVIFGCGGHAKSCADLVLSTNLFSLVGLTGLPGDIGCEVLGYPVFANDSTPPTASTRSALVGLGQIKSSEPREKLFTKLEIEGWNFPLVSSPFARISPFASIGEGTVVMPGAIINAGVRIGRGCIINTGAIVEHDAVVEDYCHISTGVVLNGDVRVGSRTFVGSGARVRNGISIPENSFIRMGEVLVCA